MVAFKCRTHGKCLHIHTCQHVCQAVARPPHELPPLATLDGRIICRDCSTPEVRELLERHDRLGEVDSNSDEAVEVALADFGAALDALRSTIGYAAVCAECLHERTGLDIRRKHAL